MLHTITSTNLGPHPMHRLSLITGEALLRPRLGNDPVKTLSTVPQRIAKNTLTAIADNKEAFTDKKALGFLSKLSLKPWLYASGIVNIILRPRCDLGLESVTKDSGIDNKVFWARNLAFLGAQCYAVGWTSESLSLFQQSQNVYDRAAIVAKDNENVIAQILVKMEKSVQELFTGSTQALTDLEGSRVLLRKQLEAYEYGRLRKKVTRGSSDYDVQEVQNMFRIKVAWGVCLEHIADYFLNRAFSDSTFERRSMNSCHAYYQLAVNTYLEILSAQEYYSLPAYQKAIFGLEKKYNEAFNKLMDVQHVMVRKGYRSGL
jgi:hypothetical protein